ncbi:MAG: outer membrane lipoprotein-sorting protein [Candidatus Omnitrophica bacterium]|nr:outer membrane lipoprotein-sorting protein [Candidatus Omnitrophota bacterium]
MKVRIGFLALFLAGLLISGWGPGSISFAQDASTDPVKILERMDYILRGESSQADVQFDVKTPKWERHYKMRVWMKGIDYAFARLLAPEKVEGQGFLRVKSRVWNYLPSAERTILIPPSLMTDRALGSEFSNDDLVKLSYLARDYEASLEGEETYDAEAAYRFRLKPFPDAPVSYEKLELWVRKKDSGPLKMIFYNERLEPIRAMHYSGYKDFNGVERPTVWRMESLKEQGRVTTWTAMEAHYDQAISESIFTRENLEKYP